MQIPEFIPIENSTSLVRQTSSMGVINTDIGAKTRYRAQRDRILSDKRQISETTEQINMLRKQLNELSEIVHRCIIRPINPTI
jgi:hypothetical protein